MDILDIHTHKSLPQLRGCVDISEKVAAGGGVPPLDEAGAYSVGIHPWIVADIVPEMTWDAMEKAAEDASVKAIGECGIDLPKGGPMFRQLQAFKRQFEISERLHKPMIIHDVKAHDILLGLHRDLRPLQKWLIHGFRGKPQLADQLLAAGFYLSFGENFNPLTVKMMPSDKILAETDDSSLSIEEIIEHISDIREENMSEAIKINTADFLADYE